MQKKLSPVPPGHNKSVFFLRKKYPLLSDCGLFYGSLRKMVCLINRLKHFFFFYSRKMSSPPSEEKLVEDSSNTAMVIFF